MDAWFYIDRDGQRRGPASAAEVARLRDLRMLLPASLLWREGMAEWLPLSALSAELGLPPPRRRMSGCLIASIACLVAGVPLLGILAAIAIPAYQDYTLRARVATVATRAAPLRLAIDTALLGGGACPANGLPGLAEPPGASGGDVAAMSTGTFDGGGCGILVTLRGPAALDGKHLWWERTGPGTWRCGGDLRPALLPRTCRGTGNPGHPAASR